MKVFIERPIATAMLYLALVALGVYSYLNTPFELAPKEDYPRLDIVASWPGVSPEIIQSMVTGPLEEAALTVKGVRKVFSESQIGFLRITLEFNPKTNMEFAALCLKEEIAKMKNSFPFGVSPIVEPYVPEDFKLRPFLSYTISGNYSLQRLRQMVKDNVELAIGSVKGVTNVEVSGGSNPEFRIILDREKLKACNIHPYQVNSALEQRFQTFPTGKVQRANCEYLLKFQDNIRGTSELDETIIAFAESNPIKLKDLAQIIPSYGDIYFINRINGQPAVRLSISKQRGANTLKVAREVKKQLELIKNELPSDLVFRIVDDESEEMRRNLADLYRLAGIITLVIFGMIFLVLRSLKPSLLILSSIAFSLVITFNLIYCFKISMNMLTLGALALGFGIFVDNSIVVFENILRLTEKGFSPRQAAIQGPKEVFLSVLASTLTTMSVFFSFAYFQGRLKIYYFPLAVVISSAIAASLLVSFSLIPALSPAFMRKARKPKEEKFRSSFEKFLNFLLGHPLQIILLVIALSYGCYRWFRSEVTLGEFFSWYSREKLYVEIGMPPGTEIEKTDGVIKKFEQQVQEASYEKEINTFVSPTNAYLIITFPPAIERSFYPYFLKGELIQLATQLAGINVSISGFDPQVYSSSMGTGPYYDSRITFYGYSLKKLKELTFELERKLRRNPRIKDIKVISNRSGLGRTESFEYILRLDKNALRKYDLDPQYLYFHLQSLARGSFETPLRATVGGRETALSVKFPEAEEMDLKNLQDSLIKTSGGEYLRLQEISNLEERAIASSINRENQQYKQTVIWEFRGPSKAAEKYKQTIFSGLRMPPGFSAALEEEWRMTEEEKSQIKFAIFFRFLLFL